MLVIYILISDLEMIVTMTTAETQVFRASGEIDATMATLRKQSNQVRA